MSNATNTIGKTVSVLLDSIVPLLTHVDPSKVVEFLQDRSARIKGVNGTFIFTIGRETIQPSLISQLEEVVDCVIELDASTTQENQQKTRRLRIKKIRGRKTSEKWVSYEIDSAKGIVFPT
jgi:archaellum biogenesis ATPase FlaH